MATGNATANDVPLIPCIFVNCKGRRFVCEDATYAYTYRAIWQQETQLVKLDGPRYYANKNVSANLGSLGGLLINTKAEVIDNNGEVIPGLYAGGMNSGGWYGLYYPGSGTSLTGGLVWGHIAGESDAAAEVRA